MGAIRDIFVPAPLSVAICEELNRTNAKECVHGRDPCITRCGVRRVREKWEPIALEERVEWLSHVDPEEQKR